MKVIGDLLRTPARDMLPLSAAVETGDTVYVSGQLALVCGRVVGDDVATQTGHAIDTIEVLLAQTGLTLANVVRTSVWLTRAENFPAFNAAYAARFAAPYPARATVISELMVPGALVEIDAIAVREQT